MRSNLPSFFLVSTALSSSVVACTDSSSTGISGAGSAATGAAVSMTGGGAGATPANPESSAGATLMPPMTGEGSSGGAAVGGGGMPALGAGGASTIGAPGSSGGSAGSAEPGGGTGDVAFSVPSGTFEGSLSVGMAASGAGHEIRYTTDGLLPTATSTLYDGTPLALTETTQLRAQPFESGAAAGAVSTAIYIRRTFDVTSDIPLIIMEGYGGGKPPTEAGPEKVVFRDLAFMLFEPVDGTAAISAPPTWASRAGYHVRGQSSASFEKTPYRVELWDDDDEDADYPMIGMPADSDWAMVSPYTDKTLIRNAFAYSIAADMGLEGPELRFAELYLNQDTGPLEAADYQGVYAVTETIKNKKGRTDLQQLRPEDTMEPDISGGYIFKFDQGALREDEGEIPIPCVGDETTDPEEEPGGMFGGGGSGTCWTDLELTDPVNPNAEQLAWIQAYVQRTHDALRAEPIGDYQQLIDLPSFVDVILLNELTKGGDKYVRSVYLHKERDGLIKAGPVWDYNFTMNNFTPDLEGWQVEDGPGGATNWFKIIFAQPEFRAAAAARWAQLRMGVFSDAQILARVDAVSAPLVNAGPRDLERWPVGESGFFGGGFGGGGEDEEEPEAPMTWEGQIDDLKQWLQARLAWVDSQIATF